MITYARVIDLDTDETVEEFLLYDSIKRVYHKGTLLSIVSEEEMMTEIKEAYQNPSTGIEWEAGDGILHYGNPEVDYDESKDF